MMLSQLLFPAVVGFLGSLHCLGMCGPLVSTLTLIETRPDAPVSPPNAFGRTVNFIALHAGRLLSYGVAGGLAALLFQAGDLSRTFFHLRSPAMIFAGVVLVLLGLNLAQFLPLPERFTRGAATGFLSGRMARLLVSPSPLSRLLLGCMFVLIPCCFTWAMIVTAAATLDPVQGFASMVAFGLGSAPALVLAGVLPWLLPTRARLFGERIAALAVAVSGVFVFLKGAGLLE